MPAKAHYTMPNSVDDPFKNLAWPGLHVPPINLYNVPKQTGLKYDSEKPRMELIDPLAAEGLARVLTFGAKKYAADNWRDGISYTRLIGALERHLTAIKRGEDIDPESGEQHIDHLGCCWMFLSNFSKTRPDLDDRWYTQKAVTKESPSETLAREWRD